MEKKNIKDMTNKLIYYSVSFTDFIMDILTISSKKYVKNSKENREI